MAEESKDRTKVIRVTETAKSVHQLMKDWYARTRHTANKDNQLAWCMGGVPNEILLNFNIDAVWPENYGAACAAAQMATGYIAEAEADGFSADICSYARNSLGYLRLTRELGRIPPEAPLGGVAIPDMLVTPAQVCDVRVKWFQAMNSRYLHKPIHVFDLPSPPVGADMNDPQTKDRYKGFYLEELRQLVQFLERQTGRKLDESRLSEAVASANEARRLFYEVYRMRRATPSPMPSEDNFACIVPELWMLGEPIAEDFYRRLYDEVQQRVRSGVAVCSPEKYRLMWVGLPPWFSMSIFNYMEELGAVSVMESEYYVGTPLEVDPANPLEALAERAWLRSCQVHEDGAEFVSESASLMGVVMKVSPRLVLRFIEEYRVDGVIIHSTRSCRVQSFGQRHIATELSKRDIPIYVFESDMADPRLWSDADIKAGLKSFLHVIDSKKG